jgi:cytochrome c553
MKAAGILRAALAAAVLVAGSAASVVATAAGPSLEPARSGPCVEDPKVMRRSHMDFMKHDRDDTVRKGVRAIRHSLAACVDCHASKGDGRVLGSDRHFCQGCHTFAAVKVDCFDCHASTARPASTATAPAQGAAK